MSPGKTQKILQLHTVLMQGKYGHIRHEKALIKRGSEHIDRDKDSSLVVFLVKPMIHRCSGIWS